MLSYNWDNSRMGYWQWGSDAKPLVVLFGSTKVNLRAVDWNQMRVNWPVYVRSSKSGSKHPEDRVK